MNAKDRKTANEHISTLEGMHAALEELAGNEREKFDNMSEGLQASERGQAIEAAADELENAVNAIQEAIDALNNACEG